MTLLLDTHAFLWWISDDARLSSVARDAIQDSQNELLLSAASGWEIAIKCQLGRLQLDDTPSRLVSEHMAQNAIGALAITMAHTFAVGELPLLHRDPFDRILVAQAQVENIAIITADAQIKRYDVDVLW